MSIFSDFFGTQGEKEANRTSDVGRQREEFINIIDQYLAQLAPGSEEYNQLLSFGQKYAQLIDQGAISVSELGGLSLDQQPAAVQFGQQLVKQQQDRIASGGAATPLESRTNLAFQGLRDVAAFKPEEQSVFSALRGLGLEGQQAPTGTIFADLVSRAQDPNKFYQSTLQPALNLAEESNRQAFARRGLLRSGLEQEGATRAGNELAIQETAQQEAFRQNQLENFLNLYGMGQNLRNREIGTEADLVNLQLGRESKLTDLLNQNTNRRLDQQFGTFSDQADLAAKLAALATQRRQDIGDAALGTVGTVAGTAIGGAIGGPVGAGIGGAIGGGLTGRKDVGSILSNQQTQTTPSGAQPTIAGGLSIVPQGGIDDLDLKKLLQQLAMS